MTKRSGKRRSSSAGTIKLCCNNCRAFETVPRYELNRAAGARCSKCGGRLVRIGELPREPFFEATKDPTLAPRATEKPGRPSKAEGHSRSEPMGTNAGHLLRWFADNAPTVMLTYEDGAWMVATDDFEGWVVSPTPEEALVLARNKIEGGA